MKILMLTQFFDPEPTFKGLVFAKALATEGHHITVVTGFPNYPGGEIYPGYKMKLYQKEVIEGIRVVRVPLFPSHGQSKIGRILNYVSFAFTSMIAIAILSFRADVVYVYHPPATVGMAAAFGTFLSRTPFVYDIQDLWPDTLRATGMINNSKVLNLIGKICSWVYAQASHLVVLSPGFKNILIQQGVPAEKIDVIYNWCHEGALAPSSQLANDSDFGMNGRFNIVFAGNMGKAQGLISVLEAAKLLQENHSEVLFTFVGSGLELKNLKDYVLKSNLKNVQFLKQRPMSEIGLVLEKAQVLLVHLKRNPLFEITVPSKTQAYMSAGKPILMAVAGDAADLVRMSNSGVVVSSENPAEIAEAIRRLQSLNLQDLEQLGKNGLNYYTENLSLKVGARKFLDLFQKLQMRRS